MTTTAPLLRAQACRIQLGQRLQKALSTEAKWPMQHQIKVNGEALYQLLEEVDRVDLFSPSERGKFNMLCSELMLPTEHQMVSVLECLCDELWGADERVRGVLVLHQCGV